MLGFWILGVSTMAIVVASSALDLAFRQESLLLCAAWAGGAFLITWPHVRRFGGRLGDGLWAGAAIGLVLILPAAPLLALATPPEVAQVRTLAASVATAGVLAASLRAQGRHFHTQRDLPQLAGPARQAAEAVVAKAGFAPISFRVAFLPSFNALVQGLRKCAVLVDRRASEALSPNELGAVIAHEVGPIRHGGLLPYLGAASLVFSGASLGDAVGAAHRLGSFDLLAAILASRCLVSQWLEFRCDRFAARLGYAEELARALERLHADYAPATRAVANSLWGAPVLSHPSLAVRSALLLGRADRVVATHRAIRASSVLGLVVLPIVARALTASAWPSLPSWAETAAWCAPAAYFAWSVVYRIVLAGAARRGAWTLQGTKSPRPWLSWTTLVVWAIALGAAPLSAPFGAPAWFPGVEWILGSLVAAPLLTVVALFLGAFRFGVPLTRGRPKRAFLEANAA
jgi:Zn-dependent protease with chaperone function